MKLDSGNLRRGATEGGVLCFAGGMLEIILAYKEGLWLPPAGLATLGIVLVLSASLRK